MDHLHPQEQNLVNCTLNRLKVQCTSDYIAFASDSWVLWSKVQELQFIYDSYQSHCAENWIKGNTQPVLRLPIATLPLRAGTRCNIHQIVINIWMRCIIYSVIPLKIYSWTAKFENSVHERRFKHDKSVAQQSFRLHFDYYVIIPYNTLIVYQVPHVCHDAYIST